MIPSLNGNILRVAGPLCGEFTVHRWILHTKASDAELWWFSLICAWINRWVNNRETGDLRRHRAHYDVIAMIYQFHSFFHNLWPTVWSAGASYDKTILVLVLVWYKWKWKRRLWAGYHAQPCDRIMHLHCMIQHLQIGVTYAYFQTICPILLFPRRPWLSNHRLPTDYHDYFCNFSQNLCYKMSRWKYTIITTFIGWSLDSLSGHGISSERLGKMNME